MKISDIEKNEKIVDDLLEKHSNDIDLLKQEFALAMRGKYGKVLIKDEKLEKGWKSAAVGLATIGALSGNIQAKQPNENHKQQILSAISHVESSGGKNTKHARLPASGIHQGNSAYGHYGLTPLLVKETIKKHPDLNSKHKKIHSLNGKDFHQYMDKNPDLEHVVASRHYDRLAKKFGHNPEKIGYAWLNGINGTLKAEKKNVNFKKHWHVKKLLNAMKMQKSELAKGSLQSKMPFDPRSNKSQGIKNTQRNWTHDEQQTAKYQIPRMEGNVRSRALNKLHSVTEVRRHPETGERMFLLHRGYDPKRSGHDPDSFVTSYKDKIKGWTPHYSVAKDFGLDYNRETEEKTSHVISAWIPESAIHHIPNQFNAPDRHGRSTTEKDEYETLVHHTDHYPLANMDALEQSKGVHGKINQKFKEAGPSDKSRFKAKSLERHPTDWEKNPLAASEDLSTDVQKHDFSKNKNAPLHGWIDPQGNYTRMDAKDGHQDFIKNQGLGYQQALKEGWISVGHGGENNAGIHKDVITNKLHPAMSTFRKLLSTLEPTDEGVYIDSHGHKEPPAGWSPLYSEHGYYVDPHDFSKHGLSPKSIIKEIKPTTLAASEIMGGDLQKGSLQRKNKFNPARDISPEERHAVEYWQTAGEARHKIPEMSKVAKKRALRVLHSKTEVRKHPETGERMFLLHRGVSDYENKKSKLDSHSSWTPDYKIAAGFATQYLGHDFGGPSIPKPTVWSAWIPESQIHYIPSAIGDSKLKTTDGKKFVEEIKQKLASKTNKFVPQKNHFKEEHEIIVKPHDLTFARPQSKKNDVNLKINQKFNNSLGDKSKYKAKDLEYVSGGKYGDPDESRNVYAKYGGTSQFLKQKKLAASENITPDLLKMSQPTLKFSKIPQLPTRTDQEVKMVDPKKRYPIKQDPIYEEIMGPKTISQIDLEGKKLGNKVAREYKRKPNKYEKNTIDQVVQDQVTKPLASNMTRGVNVGLSNNSTSLARTNVNPKSLQVTIDHEAAHNLMNAVSSRFSEGHTRALTDKLVSLLHPDDKEAITHYLSHDGRYKKDSHKFPEEILAHARDLLVSPMTRDNHAGTKNALPINYKTLKRSWKDIANYAKSLTPDLLHQLYSESNYDISGKPLKVSANMAKSEQEPIIKLKASDILAHHKGMESASLANSTGRGSKTSGPLHVHKLDDGRHLLIDGYHRFAQGLKEGREHFYAKIVGHGYSDYATPTPQEEFKGWRKPRKLLGKNEHLAKGEKGDWKKEGYTFEHSLAPKSFLTPNVNWHTVKAFDNKGELAGEYGFAEKTGENQNPKMPMFYTSHAKTGEPHRKKGIASEAYRIVEEKTGKKLEPSPLQTDNAKKLWAQPNRPFGIGKNEHLAKGDIKNAAKAAVIGAAMTAGLSYMDNQDSEKPQRQIASVEQPYKKPASITEAQSRVASAETDLINHRQKTSLLESLKKHAKSDVYGMSPIVIRQTIKNNPELNKKYGYIHQMNNQNMLESVAQAKAIHEIANKHYDKLANEFNHNKHKIVHAWFNGVQHTKQMEKTGHDFSTQPFVKEIVEKM